MSIIDIMLVIGTCISWFAAGALGVSGDMRGFLIFTICGCCGAFYIIIDVLVPNELDTNLGE